MKIRLEIIFDDGKSKEIQIQGTPTSESILDLINQLTHLVPCQPVVSSSQPPERIVQVQQPQIHPDLSQYNSQPAQHKPTNIGGTRSIQIADEEYSRLKNESLTIKERLELFLNFEYKDQWFTSLEVKRDYDRVYPSIKLSTVSTYLSRLYREGKLERMGNRNQRKYRLRTEMEQPAYLPETIWDQGMHIH